MARCPQAQCPGPRPPPPAHSHICYLPARGRLETFALRDVPRALGAKLAVLRLLTGYMQRRLREVSWGAGRGAPALTPCLQEGASPAPQPPAALGLWRCCCCSATGPCR